MAPPAGSVKDTEMVTASGSPDAHAAHRSVIDGLAKEMHLPADEVATVYLAQVRRLEGRARIKSFVTVLAAGSTRAELRRTRRS
jgi:hypothetical protein